MRSAINFFTLNDMDLENNPCILRLFKYFYRIRPLRPKYSTFWPVSKVLDYLKPLHPPESLSLKDLTLKTLSLIALSSSDRGQTIHLADTEKMVLEDDGSVNFLINDRIKTTRRVLKNKFLHCCTCKDEEFNVAKYVLFYINSTNVLRENYAVSGKTKSSQLFYSWSTKKPVSRQTLSRWLKEVLKLSGISNFGSHSFRGAGLSEALAKGASIPQIVAQGNWSNISIFHNHYNAPNNESHLGQLILDN